MLCSQANDTYALFSLEKVGLQNILGLVGRNEIVGSFGRFLDDLLIKKSLRRCRILDSFELGIKLVNSTYTGMLGWLQSKKVDLVLRRQPNYLQEDWLQKTVPVQMENVMILQYIKDKKSYFNLLDNFNVGLTLAAVYLLSFLGILSLSFLINELTRRIRLEGRGRIEVPRRRIQVVKRRTGMPKRIMKMLKRIAKAVSSFGVTRLSAIGIFVLFTHLFLWLNELFLTNNIKTNKVVVDTSQLIKDKHDIFATNKVACMTIGEELANMAVNSSARSFLWRIFHEKTRLRPDMVEERELLKGDRCFFGSGKAGGRDALKHLSLMESESIFTLYEQAAKKIWFNSKDFYEYNKVFYYSLRHRENKEQIGGALMRHAEYGLLKRIFICMDRVARESARKSEITLYESLDAYIDEYSGFSDLALDNFWFIFFYYFLICSLVFVAFCLHHLAKWAKKRAILLPAALRGCFTRFASLRTVRRSVSLFYRFRFTRS